MTTDLAKSTTPNLPVAVNSEIQQLRTLPEKYLDTLPAEKVEDVRPECAITLLHYKNGLDRGRQLMYLSMMIKEVNDFFNVKGSMSAPQIRITAELILDNPGFYDLTLGNIKACFRQHMMSAKLYDRLDGNIIIQWLREFKSEMADYCENFNLGRDRAEHAGDSDVGAITHTAYMEMLKSRAESGDESAKKIIDEYNRRARIVSPESQRAKEMDFRRFKAEYIKKKIQQDETDRQQR